MTEYRKILTSILAIPLSSLQIEELSEAISKKTSDSRLASGREPWNLIRCAIQDLKAQELNPRVEINMDDWHVPEKDTGGVCYQCLAGTVLSKTLGVRHNTYVGIEDYRHIKDEYGTSIFDKLSYLDELRTDIAFGILQDAYDLMQIVNRRFDLDLEKLKEIDSDLPYNFPYEDNPEEFKKAFLTLADKLEEIFSNDK